MRFDPDSRALRFASTEELERFHHELSALVRQATFAAHSSEEDAEAARALSREVFREFSVVMRTLNALRKHLPRQAG